MFRYEGVFKDSIIEGQGIYYFDKEGKKVYEGEFKNGKMHGIGCIKYSNGDVIEGSWIDGKKDGNFVFKSPNQPDKS